MTIIRAQPTPAEHLPDTYSLSYAAPIQGNYLHKQERKVGDMKGEEWGDIRERREGERRGKEGGGKEGGRKEGGREERGREGGQREGKRGE